MKEKRKHRKIYFLILLYCSSILTACGNEENGSIYNFSGAEPKEIDPWVYLQDTTLSSSAQIRSFASSAGSLGITIGVMGIVFSIFYMALRLLVSGSVKTRSEVKEEALMKGLIAIMIFSIPLWLGICKLLGDALV